MLSKRAIQTLSLVERQALWHHARRRGQCVRCFHASIQRGAENEVSGKGASREESDKGSPKANVVENVQARPKPPDSFDSASPHQPTKPASTQDRRRHQRSAMISEEVQMVQRDHPSPTFTADNPNAAASQPPPTAQTETPEGSAMGSNDPVSREGPTGQGIGKAVATEEDVPDLSGLARGARSPQEGVEEPAAGGAAVIGTAGQGRQTARLVEEDGEEIDEEEMDEEEAPVQTRRVVPQPDIVEPSQTLSREELLYSGHETSTLAGGNVQGVVADHLRMVAHPGEPVNSERDPKQLAEKLMARQLVHFHSAAEKAAAEEHARKIVERQAKNFAEQHNLSSDETQPETRSYHFAPMSEGVRKSILDTLGKGTYDPEGLLDGKQKYKQPLMNELARGTLMNGTFMKSDGDRFLRKVQSLLPAMQTSQQKPGSKPQQAKAK